MSAISATTNIAQHFLDTVQKRKDQPLVWEKRRNIYQSLSWKEIASRANVMTRALSALGAQKYDRVINAFSSGSSCLILDIATMTLGVTSVTFNPGFPVEQTLAAIKECQAKMVFADSSDLVNALISEETGAAGHVEIIVVPDALNTNAGTRIRIMTWSMLMEKGQSEPDKFAQHLRAIQSRDTIALFYAFQDHKLVAIKRSHSDIISLCKTVLDAKQSHALSDQDIFLVTAPHSHLTGYYAGHILPVLLEAQIAYADAYNADDMSFKSVSPTVLVGTSSYFTQLKTYTIEQIKSAGSVDSMALEKTLKLGKIKYESKSGLSLTQKIVESSLKPIVINRIRNQLGGKLHTILTLDSNMHYDTQLFFYAFGIDLVEVSEDA